MSREKQIEEIKNDICTAADYCYGACNECNLGSLAESLYNAGYRKQSEGEWILVQERDCYYTCSNCKGGFKGYKFNYCPNCGAKMKE